MAEPESGAAGARPRRSWTAAGCVRILLVVLAGLALMQPYLTRGIIGGGDAKWYAIAVGDFLEQVRSGIFPVWVGQSRYLFYGGVFPLRVAPYLEHFAALVDLMTGRSLPLFVVLNVALASSLVLGFLSCHFCLAKVIPGRPWMAAVLAFLYASCPGVLGLAYAQDLYMSFMTLPFLPFVFLGIVRSFERDDLASRLLMAGGLAGAWLAHPPIALACGMLAVLTQVARVWQKGVSGRSILLDVAAVATFLLLGGYTLVSAAAIRRGAGVADVRDFVSQVRGAFPDNWRPLPRMVPLDNLQMGYGLAALFFWLLAASLRRRSPLKFSLVLAGVLILVSIVPVPILNSLLWHLAPQAVLNVINVWPMQRLLVVLALCTVFGSALAVHDLDRLPGSRAALVWLLIIPAAAWSGYEASRLVMAADATAPSRADSAVMQRPENLPVTNMFIAISMKSSAPRYASAGVMDPEMENRFLDRETRELRSSNVDAVAPGFGPGPRAPGHDPVLGGLLTGAIDANPGILDLSPGLMLAPGKRYLLVLEFLDRSYSGTLQITGKEFFRQYTLPLSGEPRAFGSGPESSRVIPLWTSSQQPVEIRLRFVPTAGEPPLDYSPFARFELQGYTPEQLNVRLESLLPYRARVATRSAVFLETPRLAVESYEATVDGKKTPVQTSADGYVIVPVEAGIHEVTVRYAAPILVQIAYWMGMAAWLPYLAVVSSLLIRSGGPSSASAY
jgi:hypothetical protein